MNFPEVYVLNVYQLLYYYIVEYLACQYVRKSLWIAPRGFVIGLDISTYLSDMFCGAKRDIFTK